MAGAAHVAKTQTGANAYFNERLVAIVPPPGLSGLERRAEEGGEDER